MGLDRSHVIQTPDPSLLEVSPLMLLCAEVGIVDLVESLDLLLGLGVQRGLVTGGARWARSRIKQALKPILKRVVRTVRAYAIAWEQEENDKRQEESDKQRNYQEDDYAYPWLNDQMTKALRLGRGALRPQFTWGVLHAAQLARATGVRRISAIEFGVAGGNGLVSLERVAEHVESVLGVGIDVYGFDTGTGLPKPLDYRDLPNLWRESAFPMDVTRLKERLKKARLVLGPVEKT